MSTPEESESTTRSQAPARHRSRGPLWRIVRSAALIYLTVTLVVFVFQRRLQYIPDTADPPLPAGERFRGVENIELRADDGVLLRAWHWPGTSGTTIVHFHGNAGNRAHRIDALEPFHRLGHGLLLLDYRGYGGSQGSPTEDGLYRDAEAAIAWLEQHGDSELIYFGESLGCGVAVEMAVRHRPRSLILQSPYTSLVDVAKQRYFFLPVRLLMKDRFDTIDKIAEVTCPILMLHGARDGLVPPEIGERLFEAAPEPKRWVLIKGVGHNDMPVSPTYREAIRQHLEGL